MSYRPKFRITSRLLSQIDDIAVTREAILASTTRATWTPAQRPEGRRVRNTHSSSGFDGKSFTLEKVLALANGQDFPIVTERSERQLLTHFSKRLSVGRTSGRVNWTHEDVLKLHKVIARGEVMDQRPAGRYRTINVRAGRFVPPPPSEVSRLMCELLEWWNTKALELSAVVTSAIVHYRISDIHPFPDGNGRVGRALALWELYRNGFDSHSIFSLNEHYWGERRHYYAALRAVYHQGEDLTGWLEYSAEGLRLALERIQLRTQQQSSLLLRPTLE